MQSVKVWIIMVYRLIKEQIDKRLYRGKVIIVVGPRQVGKTTLLRMLTADSDRKVVVWNCDEPDVRRKLAEPTSTQLGAETANADLILIDEAQRVQNIGITLKLLVDNYPDASSHDEENCSPYFMCWNPSDYR